jgi:hypothetical protein
MEQNDTNINKEKIDDLAKDKSTPDNSGIPTWVWIFGIITIVIILLIIYFTYKDDPQKFIDDAITSSINGLINSY